MRASIFVIAGLLAAPGTAAWAVGPTCGPDCTTPGRIVLCNDSFDMGQAIGGTIQLNEIEYVCAAFDPPSAAAFTLTGGYGLFAPVPGSNPTIFDMRVYDNGPNGGGPPMGQFMPIQNGNLQITGAGAPAFYSLQVSPTYSFTGDFRLCLLSGLDDSDMGMVFDGSGIQAGRNYALRGGHPWEDAAMGGVTGDFVLRAVVQVTDLTPWQNGCPGGGDAGVRPDALPAADALPPGADALPGNDDAMMSNADASVTSDDALPAGADALPGNDDASAGVNDDASTTGADAASATDAAVAAGPPTITSITPSSGSNGVATAVIVSGTNFVAGAVLRIGAIGATEVMVPGTTTLRATVPPGIAGGVYDVTVENPDHQAAVLVKGYTVVPVTGGAPPEDNCACGVSSSPQSFAYLLLLFAFAKRRRRS